MDKHSSILNALTDKMKISVDGEGNVLVADKSKTEHDIS